LPAGCFGLGSEYAPRLDQLKRQKRLFLHDGPTDIEILQTWAKSLDLLWPENLVCWKYTKDRIAREILFDELRVEIPGLKAISLQDRDDYPFAQCKDDLTFDNLKPFRKGLALRRWRRRNIENYLLHPGAIARAAGKPEKEIQDFLQTVHGLAVTEENFTLPECVQTLANTDGKEIISKHLRSVTAELRVNYRQIAEAMLPNEIPEDPKVMLRQLVDLCKL